MRTQCSKLLPDGGRLSVLVPLETGRVFLGATVSPAGEYLMPSWGGYLTIYPRFG
jgi:hypothetical protein